MKTIKCWDVQEWDGGSMTNHAFYVATKAEADKWLIDHSYDSVSKVELKIYNTVEEYLNKSLVRARERGLAKLTLIERKALGL